MTKVSEYWETIWDDFQIKKSLNDFGYYDITAKDIKKYHEPRLMCKIDYRENTPDVFKKNKASILAIQNGLYRIARTDPFVEINLKKLQGSSLEVFEIPKHFHTINADKITSESKALDAAVVSGMLENVIGESVSLTVRGREKQTRFDFELLDIEKNQVSYPVSGVQIEIDGGYEGSKTITLIEAKIGINSNINIRQLLYPYLEYSNRYKTKIITTYIMFYEAGGLYYFIPVQITAGNVIVDYASTKLCKLRNTKENDLSFSALKSIKIDISKTNNNIPFPQANDFNKIYAIFLKIIEEKNISKDELFSDFDLVPRQFDYYINVLLWLDLVEKDELNNFQLSELGEKFKSMGEKEKIYNMASVAFSNDMFNLFLKSDDPVVSIGICERNNINPHADTYDRRISTIRSWIKFFEKTL